MRTCVRENEIVRALRTDAWADELNSHARSCAACAETERVARAMLASAANVRDGLHPPGADVVWRRAQARVREAALKRATLPLRAMLTLSFVSLAIAAMWIAGQFQDTVAGDFHSMGGWDWLTAGVTVSANWVAVLLSLIVAGSCCLWFAGKRIDAGNQTDAGSYRVV